jgi:hypothetical protein
MGLIGYTNGSYKHIDCTNDSLNKKKMRDFQHNVESKWLHFFVMIARSIQQFTVGRWRAVWCLLGMAMMVSLAGCQTDDDNRQKEFEQEAYSTPSSITKTTFNGTVESRDSDDWRVSPFYAGLLTVQPPFPNPANPTQTVQLLVTIQSLDVLSRVRVWTFDASRPSALWPVWNSTSLGPGILEIPMNPMNFTPSGSVNDIRTTHRIILTDQLDQVITYGDVQIQ